MCKNGEPDSDDNWRIVAVFKAGSAVDKPHERYVYHAAGMDGRGSSSYIDDVILRERSNAKLLSDEPAPTLGSRLYYLQNWRHDVVATVTHQCRIIERTRYTSYGVPTTHTGGDFNHDGQVDDTDFLIFDDPYNNFEQVNYAASTSRSTGDYSELDLNVDGYIEDGDFGTFAVAYGNFFAATPGELSHRDPDPYANVDSRVGYAGYSWSANTAMYNVRHRVYDPIFGQWISRDSAGYADGENLYSYVHNTAIEFTDPTGRASQPLEFRPPEDVIEKRKTPPSCAKGIPDKVDPCEEARDRALNGSSSAGVVCWKGQRYTCIWRSGGSVFGNDPELKNEKARSLIDECQRAHEQRHIDQNDIKCPQEGEPGYDLITRPPFRTGVDGIRSEINGAILDISCLKQKRTKCGGDRECESIIDKEIEYTRKARDDYERRRLEQERRKRESP